MAFPLSRLRRTRSSAMMRNLVREHAVSIHDLIYPIFVTEGTNIRSAISSMPDVYHYSLDRLDEEISEVVQLGIQAVLLFGVPHLKDECGSEAFEEEGIVQRAVRQIKAKHDQLLIIADTCLCQFTDHGHCGVVKQDPVRNHAYIDNDKSLELLVRTSVSQARAGADIIAPSNMMDGFVQAIRMGLDEAGFENVPIMSYSVKYASAFYGPFRDAAHSTPQFGDRKTYQMDPANLTEAIREAESDVIEGADILMVKPALAYMDVIRAVKENFDLPLAVYNVSAEYSMVKAAARQGWIDEKAVIMEMMVGFKRAGADMIITYSAKDVANWLQ
jgi:porphobilinogen synthase